MDQETADRLSHQLVRAFMDRDVELMVSLFHPEAEIVALRSQLEGAYRGHDGVRAWVTPLIELAPDYYVTLDEARPTATGGLFVGTQGGTMRGAPFTAPLIVAVEMRDDLIARFEMFMTVAEGERAVNL